METLFTTELPTAGIYKISFHDEAYHFQPDGGRGKSFSVRRENDTWKTDDVIEKGLFSIAITALDKYLLSQH